jgi:hypothetical protein
MRTPTTGKFTDQQILDALKVKHLTRCPHPISSGCGDSSEDKAPDIGVEIVFDYGSATLNGRAKSPIVAVLALTLPGRRRAR